MEIVVQGLIDNIKLFGLKIHKKYESDGITLK